MDVSRVCHCGSQLRPSIETLVFLKQSSLCFCKEKSLQHGVARRSYVLGVIGKCLFGKAQVESVFSRIIDYGNSKQQQGNEFKRV